MSDRKPLPEPTENAKITVARMSAVAPDEATPRELPKRAPTMQHGFALAPPRPAPIPRVDAPTVRPPPPDEEPTTAIARTPVPPPSFEATVLTALSAMQLTIDGLRVEGDRAERRSIGVEKRLAEHSMQIAANTRVVERRNQGTPVPPVAAPPPRASTPLPHFDPGPMREEMPSSVFADAIGVSVSDARAIRAAPKLEAKVNANTWVTVGTAIAVVLGEILRSDAVTGGLHRILVGH